MGRSRSKTVKAGPGLGFEQIGKSGAQPTLLVKVVRAQAAKERSPRRRVVGGGGRDGTRRRTPAAACHTPVRVHRLHARRELHGDGRQAPRGWAPAWRIFFEWFCGSSGQGKW